MGNNVWLTDFVCHILLTHSAGRKLVTDLVGYMLLTDLGAACCYRLGEMHSVNRFVGTYFDKRIGGPHFLSDVVGQIGLTHLADQVVLRTWRATIC